MAGLVYAADFSGEVPKGVEVAGLQGGAEAEDAFDPGAGPVAHACLFATCADECLAGSLDLIAADRQTKAR